MLNNYPRIIIKLFNRRIYYTQNDFVEIEQTNFPLDHHVVYNGRENFYSVDIIEIEGFLNNIKLKFISPQLINYESFFNQSKERDFEDVSFNAIEIDGLEVFEYKSPPRYSSGFSNSNRGNIKINSNPKTTNFTSYESIKAKKVYLKPEVIPVEVPITVFEEEFKYYFKDATFENGFVTIEKNFPFVNRKIALRIYNPFIVSEYNYIKNYFAKILGDKRFTVKTIIKLKGGELINETTTSKEIEKINESIINQIKEERTEKVIKIMQNESTDEKSTYSVDELLASINNDKGGNIFNQDGEDIIKTLLKLKGIRSAKQFQYLGGLKHNVERNVQFTLKPNFGFLFYVKGENMYHFCWELLESHATYIWSFDKSYLYEKQLSRINQTLFFIQKEGRNKYKKLRKEDCFDGDIIFNSIIHKSKTSAFKDSFPEWKNRINEILV